MNNILIGDVIEQLKTIPDQTVNTCVTSPPYWGLRDYGTAEWKGGDFECEWDLCGFIYIMFADDKRVNYFQLELFDE